MSQPTSPLVLHLPYQSPWEWRQFHQHFALRLLAGVESLGDDHYARSFRANGRPAWFEVRPLAERQVLALSLSPSAHALAAELEARVRRMFDLDSDPAAIARHFAGDPLLGPLVAANPGLRLPVAFDPFEQAVRAIVGQQVTVKAAVTITGRLIQRLGEPLEDLGYDGISHLFPTPAALAQANLDGIGMPGKRVQTLQRFAAAIASGELSLDLADGPEALVERLCALPGIGPWTAEYIALRAMGEADAFRLQPDVAARAGDGPDDQAEHRQDDDHQDPDDLHPGFRSAFQDVDDGPDIQGQDDQADQPAEGGTHGAMLPSKSVPSG